MCKFNIVINQYDIQKLPHVFQSCWTDMVLKISGIIHSTMVMTELMYCRLCVENQHPIFKYIPFFKPCMAGIRGRWTLQKAKCNWVWCYSQQWVSSLHILGNSGGECTCMYNCGFSCLCRWRSLLLWKTHSLWYPCKHWGGSSLLQ